MMKKIFALLVIMSAFFLHGCMSDGSDSLLQAPKLPGDYLALQTSLNEIKSGGAISACPASGSNRHSVQLVDIDADGYEEAVSFFRDAPGGAQFSIYIHKKEQNGKYSLIGKVTGQGTEISQVYYPRCSENGARAVALRLKAGDELSSQSVIVGLIKDSRFQPVLNTVCSDMYVGNINDSITDELVVIQNGGEVSQFSAKLYIFNDASLENLPSVSLSAGIKGIAKIRKSSTSDGFPAVFIDGICSNKGYLTDVLTNKNGVFTNITLDSTSGISDITYRQVSMPASDILGNGTYEIPIAYPLSGYSENNTDIQWRLEWNTVSSDGELRPVITTYHNISEEWYLTFPEKWGDKITVTRETSSYGGLATFAESKNGQLVPIFTIYAVQKDEQVGFNNIPEYICIGANSSKTYYISLSEQGKDSAYFLTEEEIRAVFNIIPKIWASEVYGS